jgi:hypothetical protein
VFVLCSVHLEEAKLLNLLLYPSMVWSRIYIYIYNNKFLKFLFGYRYLHILRFIMPCESIDFNNFSSSSMFSSDDICPSTEVSSCFLLNIFHFEHGVYDSYFIFLLLAEGNWMVEIRQNFQRPRLVLLTCPSVRSLFLL